MDKIISRIVVAFVVFSPIVTWGEDRSGSVSLPRSEVVARIKKSVSIKLLDDGPEQADARLAFDTDVDAEIEKDALNILPDEITASSNETLATVLSVPLSINFRDNGYCRAAVRLYLSYIPARVKYLEKFPPMNEPQKSQVLDSIRKALNTLQLSMEDKLVSLSKDGLTKERIDAAIASVRDDMCQEIGRDPFSVFLTVPLNEEKIAEIDADFASRLEQSVPLLRAQIADAVRNLAPGQDSSKVIADVIQRILVFGQRKILDATSDPQRLEFGRSIEVSPALKKAQQEYAKVIEAMLNRGDESSSHLNAGGAVTDRADDAKAASSRP